LARRFAGKKTCQKKQDIEKSEPQENGHESGSAKLIEAQTDATHRRSTCQLNVKGSRNELSFHEFLLAS
jgi:hypothetical protein